jgi:hypothetical protein
MFVLWIVLLILTQETVESESVYFKVSVQGVKSLWGDCRFIPVMGTGDTNRWRINNHLNFDELSKI